ncbi:hypothetical protein ACFV1W_25380 [Kitasatospora sp. NPDC059648]|uniref:hypothetical protein n=1 Tax=Kitasatospora sp. NPDC059648 TaxID=3346894 RepID=UPI00367AE795
MVIVYLALGVLAYLGWGWTSPTDAVLDLQADQSRPPLGREIAAAVVLWSVLLVVWPLAVVIRGALALRHSAGHRLSRRDWGYSTDGR